MGIQMSCQTNKNESDEFADSSVKKFSISLPKALYSQLVELLKSPMQITDELERGSMSRWVRECAEDALFGTGELTLLRKFIADSGYEDEFHEYRKLAEMQARLVEGLI
jgi:hypothetical protein